MAKMEPESVCRQTEELCSSQVCLRSQSRRITTYGRCPVRQRCWKSGRKGDCDFFNSVDSMYYYHREQIEDFLKAVENGTKPLVDARDGRKTVELFTAIYRSTESGMPVKFPLK